MFDWKKEVAGAVLEGIANSIEDQLPIDSSEEVSDERLERVSKKLAVEVTKNEDIMKKVVSLVASQLEDGYFEEYLEPILEDFVDEKVEEL